MISLITFAFSPPEESSTKQQQLNQNINKHHLIHEMYAELDMIG